MTTTISPREAAADEYRGTPLNVAVLDECDLVLAGLEQMLAPYADRVRIVRGSRPDSAADVVLWGGSDPDQPSTRPRGGGLHLRFTWGLTSRAGELSKQLSGAQLVEEVEAAVRAALHGAPTPPKTWWVGQETDLSQHEAEILALIGSGLTNDEVANRLYLSINTVKSYIRTAYRKIGVVRRSQAVLWVNDNRLRPLPASPPMFALP